MLDGSGWLWREKLRPGPCRANLTGQAPQHQTAMVGASAAVLTGSHLTHPAGVPMAFVYSGLGFSGLSSWSIGGHSPLLQRSQNFLLRIADVELVPLAIGPPSPPQAASVSTAARSIPAAIHLEPGCIEISAPRCGGLNCRRITGRTGAHRAWSPRSVAAFV